jgi:hypothetical protein
MVRRNKLAEIRGVKPSGRDAGWPLSERLPQSELGWNQVGKLADCDGEGR